MWSLAFIFLESTVSPSSYVPIYLASRLLQKSISCHWVCLLLVLPLPQPEFWLAWGPSLVKQRGVKRSLENVWKNTCSLLSVIYSVHKVSGSPLKGCKSPRKAVLNDLHLIFMIHMAFHPKCQKWKKKLLSLWQHKETESQFNMWSDLFPGKWND